MTSMTKEVFKARWEKDDRGDGITYDDIADCAVSWGIARTPRIHSIDKIKALVLATAGIKEEIDE